MTDARCICGDTETHVVGRRRSFDGVSVLLWSDGSVTGWAEALPGVPVRRPRTTEAREVTLRAGWIFLDEAALYEQDELGTLYRAAETVARRGGLPGDVRAEVARLMEPRVTFCFKTIETDVRGDWVEQWTALNRLHWPGLAVLRTRAGYELLFLTKCPDAADPTVEGWESTGFRFRNRADLTRHLNQVKRAAPRRNGRAP